MENLLMADIDYLSKQSSDSLNVIMAQMTGLITDNDTKVEMLENQPWYERMVKTVFGKNKVTRDEIKRNHERLTTYTVSAMKELFNRQMIHERMIVSLGNRINEVYLATLQNKKDILELKQMLGQFVLKLNEKIESVDNFHLLRSEIGWKYKNYHAINSIGLILSQLDKRTLRDSRKMDSLYHEIEKNQLFNEKQMQIPDLLLSVTTIPIEDVAPIYLEMTTLKGSLLANLIQSTIENYNFLSDKQRKFKKKEAVVQRVIEAYDIDDSITVSSKELFIDFLDGKIAYLDYLSSLESLPAPKEEKKVESTLDEAFLKKLTQRLEEADRDSEVVEIISGFANQRKSEAEALLGLMYYEGWDVKESISEGFKWIKKSADKGNALGELFLGILYLKGDAVPESKQKGFELIKKSSASLLGAEILLAHCYNQGVGTQKNLEEAFNIFLKHAKMGYADAQAFVALFYYRGYGVEVSEKKASNWMDRARSNDSRYTFPSGRSVKDGVKYLLDCLGNVEIDDFGFAFDLVFSQFLGYESI